MALVVKLFFPFKIENYTILLCVKWHKKMLKVMELSVSNSLTRPSLVAQLVKNPPAMRETWLGKIPWRRERLPTPAFWPGEFHGLHSPWGHKESDTTGQLSPHFQQPTTHTCIWFSPELTEFYKTCCCEWFHEGFTLNVTHWSKQLCILVAQR